jgi:two-component system cell cycle response regulator DivK
MAYAFDGRGFAQVLRDAERLVTGAREHERQLTSLLSLLEVGGSGLHAAIAGVAMPSIAQEAATGPTPIELGAATDLVAIVRQLHLDAGEQRQLAEAMLMRLVGPRVSTDGQNGQRPRVLVVDDSDNSRDMTAAILEEAGFETMTATNGLEGVLMAHYARPAVVLMDVTMPVLNGLEAARLLGTSEATRDLRVIAYTAKPDFHEGPFSTWFADILRKPATADAIVASVQRFVTPGRSTLVDDDSRP